MWFKRLAWRMILGILLLVTVVKTPFDLGSITPNPVVSHLPKRLKGHALFRNFDGNAQGFRILTQLENYKWAGGLQLTCAVLGAFTKYPRASTAAANTDNYPGWRKVGFFKPEQAYFAEIAETLDLTQPRRNLPYWRRHPLAFLVEAADDICYAIIDIEDGYELGYLNFQEAKGVLAPLAGDNARLNPSMEQKEQIGKLRAVAIGELMHASAKVFLDNEDALRDGSFNSAIVKLTKFKSNMQSAVDLARDKLYNCDRTTKLEIASTEVITGLLNIFADVVVDLESKGFDISKLTRASQRLARLMGVSLDHAASANDALHCVTDFVSGMTDRLAVETYRTLKGISL